MSLETKLDDYLVQRLSTSVFYRERIEKEEKVVYVSLAYKSILDAVKGHQEIFSKEFEKIDEGHFIS